ncbi:MAG: hypothetical protein HHAS10_09970 [Candidatus Altimarinota bacterium]
MNSSRQGSALLISLIVLTLMMIMSSVFFEKVFRFSQASEGIENSNIAYYKALGIIETAMYGAGVNKYTPWNIKRATSGGSYSTSGATLEVNTGSYIVPAPGKGNSPYDPNYNIISIGEPVQLVIPNGINNWGTVIFQFRIPQISANSSTGVYAGGTNSGYVLWTFASSGASLFASGETNIFRGSELNNSNQLISTRIGKSNSGSSVTFGDFYFGGGFVGADGAFCSGYQCTLKLSLLRPIITANSNRTVNFLEYKITFPNTVLIPAQYMDLKAEGYAYGFLRQRSFQFPQITTNTALDFAVLQ